MRYKGLCGGHLSIDMHGVCCELQYKGRVDTVAPPLRADFLKISHMTLTTPLNRHMLKEERCWRCLVDGFERAYTETKKRHFVPQKISVYRHAKDDDISQAMWQKKNTSLGKPRQLRKVQSKVRGYARRTKPHR